MTQCELIINEQCPKEAIFRIQIEGQYGIENIHVCNKHLQSIPKYVIAMYSNPIYPMVIKS